MSLVSVDENEQAVDDLPTGGDMEDDATTATQPDKELIDVPSEEGLALHVIKVEVVEAMYVNEKKNVGRQSRARKGGVRYSGENSQIAGWRATKRQNGKFV